MAKTYGKLYYIQFFCLEKPIGLTLSCLEWPKPMLLAQNCINLNFNYYNNDLKPRQALALSVIWHRPCQLLALSSVKHRPC